jgi:hypothetical protein
MWTDVDIDVLRDVATKQSVDKVLKNPEIMRWVTLALHCPSCRYVALPTWYAPVVGKITVSEYLHSCIRPFAPYCRFLEKDEFISAALKNLPKFKASGSA